MQRPVEKDPSSRTAADARQCGCVRCLLEKELARMLCL